MTRVRTPTPQEVEKLRLILSAYQDGTGMYARPDGSTIPGWRDFERAVALAMGGKAQESKFIFDVLVPDSKEPSTKYGLSCKSKDALEMIDKKGRAYLELSNSSKKFWDYLETKGIKRENYRVHPLDTGIALIELVTKWHRDAKIAQGGQIDLAGSSYLTLSYSEAGWYQLHQFSLRLPNPRKLHWYFPERKTPQAKGPGLRGQDNFGTILEWYGESGGQLKYYPLVKNAVWSSDRFRLEPLNKTIEHGILAKVAAYFPDLWTAANKDS